MELLEDPAVGGLIDLGEYLQRPGFIATRESVPGGENSERYEDHPGVLDRLPTVCLAVSPLHARKRIEVFVSGLASMLEQVDEDPRGAALLEPDQAGSGTGAGGQPFGDCAASVPAVIEDLCDPLSQYAPLAAPARIDAVLKPASGAGTADINAKAFATDPGSEEDPPDLPTAAAILPPAHGPVPAGRASRAVRQESDPVAPATSHAHRQPDTFDIRFLR
jgi:hypothetical protein